MSYSLVDHERGYRLSCCEGLLSAATLFSGAPYVKRHWELSNKPEFAQHRCGHRTLAILQSIPVLGGSIALVERIISCANRGFFEENQSKSQDHSKSRIKKSFFSPSQYETFFPNENQLVSPSKQGNKPFFVAETLHVSLPSPSDAFQYTCLPSDADASSLTPNAAIFIDFDTPTNKSHAAATIGEIASRTANGAAGRAANGEIQYSQIPWRLFALSIDEMRQKMWINAKKAIEEHWGNVDGSEEIIADSGYALSQKALPPIKEFENPVATKLLECRHFSAASAGCRPSMEDAHFYMETKEWILTGVFDGHGGKQVADYTSGSFQVNFATLFNAMNGNIHKTFEILIHQIHENVTKIKDWHRMGSTAVISFIDKHTHSIYTATLGDSEANIYRTIDQQWQSIPLSCVRDWSSKRDAERASVSLDCPSIKSEWPMSDNSKALRYPHRFGINVSRAIGDMEFSGTSNKPGVIHKPKITMNKLQQGDLLILACDGLRDFVSEKEIEQQIMMTQSSFHVNLAEQLVNYAIKDKESQDNVTVIVVYIGHAQ